jgi:hypothetical protein
MITVAPIYEKQIDPNAIYVNTTSRSSESWSLQLSPFYLGPCDLYEGVISKNMENAWQYSKVYDCHIDSDGDPTTEYFEWAVKGWNNNYAQRYPMCKGAIPKYSFWNGHKLDYVAARKHIYVPLYAKAVLKTNAYKNLQELVKSGKDVYLLDFDAYKHREQNMTMTDVLNCPDKKMGHAFVLFMMLTEDKALHDCNLLP